MGKDKSIIEKFADTLRDVAKTATEAASEALKSEGPAASKVEQRTAAYVPLAADGLVSDPLMVPLLVQPRPRRTKRAARKRAAKRTTKTATRRPAKKTARKSSAKSAKKSAARRSRPTSKKTVRKTKTAAKRRVGKSRRR